MPPRRTRNGGSVGTRASVEPLFQSKSKSQSPEETKKLIPIIASPPTTPRSPTTTAQLSTTTSTTSTTVTTTTKSKLRKSEGDEVWLASKLPRPLLFPTVLLLSFALSSGAYTLVAPHLAELGGVSRKVDTWWGVWGVVLWRGFELALGWFGNFDSYDLVSLSLVSRGPVLYLLHAFYNISPQPLLLSLLIDTTTASLPFYLIRALSPAHSTNSSNLPNKDLLTDTQIQSFTTLLATTIYAVTLSTAYNTYLTTSLAVHFNNLPTIISAYSASPVTLFPLCLPLGLAVKSFIFTPATTASSENRREFDPTTATLSETFWYNVWGWDIRTKTVIARTVALMLVSGGSTFVQSFVSLEGVEAQGAIAYAGVWVFAALVTGTALGVAGAV
ncbi:hypothetical protein B7463_g1523, partial [Scytalidium lignicola]